METSGNFYSDLSVAVKVIQWWLCCSVPASRNGDFLIQGNPTTRSDSLQGETTSALWLDIPQLIIFESQ